MANSANPPQQGGTSTPAQQPQQGSTPAPQQGSAPRPIRDWASI